MKKVIYPILLFLFLVFISSFVSCIKEKECPKLPPPDEISACDVDIDETISFDTLWNIKVGDHSVRKYFDKYFVVYYYRDEIILSNDKRELAKIKIIKNNSIYNI